LATVVKEIHGREGEREEERAEDEVAGETVSLAVDPSRPERHGDSHGQHGDPDQRPAELLTLRKG